MEEINATSTRAAKQQMKTKRSNDAARKDTQLNGRTSKKTPHEVSDEKCVRELRLLIP